MDLNALVQNASVTLVAVGWKLAGAVVLWLTGRWLISFATRLLGQALDRHQFDVTLTRYAQTALKIVLNVALIVFLVFLRPFKIGDFVTAGGVTGTVDTIGLFGTVINTPDNVRTIVGNNKVFGDTIQNFSANPYRRVDLTAIINQSVDHRTAIRVLKQRLSAIPNVLGSPAPDVDVLEFTPAGPQLCVRPYCNNDHYWQVYFDTNRLIREAFGEAGFPAPMPAYAVSGPFVGPALDVGNGTSAARHG